jgi:hypothetical protein
MPEISSWWLLSSYDASGLEFLVPSGGDLVMSVSVRIDVSLAWSWLFWSWLPVLLCWLSPNLLVWRVLCMSNLCCLCWGLLGVWLQLLSVCCSVSCISSLSSGSGIIN